MIVDIERMRQFTFRANKAHQYEAVCSECNEVAFVVESFDSILTHILAARQHFQNICKAIG